MPLSDIVNITITQDVQPIAQANFGVMLVMGTQFNLDDRVIFFSDVNSAIAACIGTGTKEESLINLAFSQNPAPAQIALGSIQTTKTATFSGTMTGGSITAVINGKSYTEAWATSEAVTLGALATLIAADTTSKVSTAVYSSGSNTLVITPKTGMTASLVINTSAVVGTLAAVITAAAMSETFVTALGIADSSYPGWYPLVVATKGDGTDTAVQEAIADWTETTKHIYIAGSADPVIASTTAALDSSSIAHYVSPLGKSLMRTAVLYTTNAATEGVEAGWFAKFLPLDPGTYTAFGKTISGATVDTLSTNSANNVRAKFANTYESIGGKGITRDGLCGGNEYIDVLILIDWLYATMQTTVFNAITSQPKVPYTPAGLLIVQSAISSPLQQGQDRGAISPNAYDPTDGHQIGGYVINMPVFSSIPTNDKASRLLQDVSWTAWISGAIQAIKINGVVTV